MTLPPSTSASSAGQFRADINGLRAWAVAAVVLFHFHATGFGGGFVGVDVFFVISGFLMTGIVTRGLEQGRFSLWRFYLARANRILPALLAMLAVLLVLGYFLLLPHDYRVLGTHSVYSILFFTNVKFWQEAGYFDAASHEKWLLHTWSLSVEWQFYLILPVALLLAWRLRPARSTLTVVCAMGLLASLAASIWLTGRDSSAAFFLLHTRAWEMLAGGLVFLLGRRQALQSAAVAWTGLALIALSIALFDGATPWPGWRALLPVAGAMLVLAANRPVPGTAHPLMQWLGDRSYSIYLWHWPVVVVLAYAGWQAQPLALALGVLASLALGALSYAYVEQPAREKLGTLAKRGIRPAALAIGTAAALTAIPAFFVWQAGGIAGRFPPAVELAAAGAQDFHPERKRCHQRAGASSPGCVFGAAERSAIVIGDSHVAGLVSAIAAAGEPLGKGVQQWSYDGCIYLPAMRQVRPDRFSKDNDCAGFNRWVSAQLRTVPRDVPVILIGRYARYAMGPNEHGAAVGVPEVYFDSVAPTATPAFLQRFGAELTAAACALARERPVYMMRPVPEMPVNVPDYMARRMAWGLDGQLSLPLSDYRQRNAWVWDAQDQASRRCGVRILDPLPAMCPGQHCIAGLHGRPLFYDHGHMSEFGNKLLVPMFRQVFEQSRVAAAHP